MFMYVFVHQSLTRMYLFFKKKIIYVFIYFWLSRVLVAARRIFVAAHGSSLRCVGFSLVVARAGSVVAACELSCSAACGILVPLPGIEPMPPALEGGFLTTGPPQKDVF